MGIKVLISINFFLLVVSAGHFLPGWTADWCRCQGGMHSDIWDTRKNSTLIYRFQSTGNLRSFRIFHISDAFRHWEWHWLLRLLEYTKIGATGWLSVLIAVGSSSGRLKPKLLFVSIMVVAVLPLQSLSSSSSFASSTASCSSSASSSSSLSPSTSLMIGMSLISQSSLVSSPSAAAQVNSFPSSIWTN